MRTSPLNILDKGRLAQWLARCFDIAEVRGSNPLVPTMTSKSKQNLADIRPGDKVKVFQRIAEIKKNPKEKEKKEKIQTFEGIVIARKHGKEPGATITVRRITGDIGVEKIFPLHLPTIEKIEVLSHSKVRRTKLYYLRSAKGKKLRLKKK